MPSKQTAEVNHTDVIYSVGVYMMMDDPDIDFYGLGDDPDAEYVCRLDARSLETARVELNEDPRERLGAVKTFRQWLLQQSHIKSPTGE